MTQHFDVAVAVCGHNQRAQVAELFDRLTLEPSVSVHYLDDGSTDGTIEMIRRSYPSVDVVVGSGDLYWGGGMRRAIDRAVDGDPHLILWLNADTMLTPGGIPILASAWREAHSAHGEVILVGASTDPADGSVTYSALTRRDRLNFERVVPDGTLQEADAMNGNIVLMTPNTYRKLGGIDPRFPHQMGDIDFAMRARSAGVRVLLAPEPLGICRRNSQAGTSHDPGLRRWERFRMRAGVKELWPSAWWTFTRRHAGRCWPTVFLKPYLDALLRNR